MKEVNSRGIMGKKGIKIMGIMGKKGCIFFLFTHLSTENA